MLRGAVDGASSPRSSKVLGGEEVDGAISKTKICCSSENVGRWVLRGEVDGTTNIGLKVAFEDEEHGPFKQH